jgi:hypothetical protein
VTYTRDQVSAAVNAGVELVMNDKDIYFDGKTTDLLNLVANAALSVLDQPGMSLDDVILSNYQPDIPDDYEPPIESEDDPRYPAAVVATVRGWVS